MKETCFYRISKACKEVLFNGTTAGGRALENEGLDIGGISQVRAPYEISRKFAERHSLLFTLGGSGRLDVPGPRRELKAGTLCLIPAGMDHAYGTDSSWHLLWFHPLPVKRWNTLMPDKAVITVSHWTKQILVLVEEFQRESLQSDGVNHASLLSGYVRLITQFIEREMDDNRRIGPPGHRKILETIRWMIAENPGEHWTVESLAHAAGLSRSLLQLLVHRTHGCGVMEMVARLRMEQAASLILQGHRKLDDIAEHVGYSSPFSFSSAFKRIMGIAPRQYARGRLL